MKRNVHSYTVTGMDCPDCAVHLEKRINALEGVQNAKVNFFKSTISVNHIDKFNESELKKAVRQAGYSLNGKAEYQNKSLLFFVVFSGLALLLGYAISYFIGKSLLTKICLLGAILIGGYPVAIQGFKEIRTGRLGMNFLMTLAITGAVILGEWFEAGMVVFLFVLAQLLESRTMAKARRSVQMLLGKRVDNVRLKSGTKSEIRSIEMVKPGEIIIIRPGDQIPLDGSIVSGQAEVNQAMITGESAPVAKEPGDFVYAGSISLDGYLEVSVSRSSKDSTISRIIQLIEEAQQKKAPKQAFIEKFARYYTPVIIIIAVMLAVLPSVFFENAFRDWVYRSLVVLIIACPCALVISTPIAIITGLTAAMKQGILVKGGVFLEDFNKVDAIAFDKTGTITSGEAVITNVMALNGQSSEDILSVAASLEKYSEHPLSRPIIAFAEERNSRTHGIDRFKVLKGKGIEGWLSGQYYFLGNRKLCAEKKLLTSDLVNICTNIEDATHTVVFVGSDEKVIGIIAFSDKIRKEAIDIVSKLKDMGLQYCALLTGDNMQAAQAVAKSAKIEQCFSELLPDEKVKVIKSLKSKFSKVVMVGDGLNDAPALAAADIGIAMGRSGTDITLETADIIFMKDDLSKLAVLKKISQKTLSVIKQNIFIALILKFTFLLLAIPGLATLWMAVFADMGASLIVIFNGLRILRRI